MTFDAMTFDAKSTDAVRRRILAVAAMVAAMIAVLAVPATLLTPSLGAQTPSGDAPRGSAAIDTAGFPKAAEIRGSRVNIRTTPSKNARVIIQLPDRARVLATARNGDWVRFSLPPEVKVWISQKYLEAVPGDTQLRVRGNAINLRATPGTKFLAIGQVSHGTLVRPTGHIDTISEPDNGPWVEIDAPVAASGWVFGQYIGLGRSLSAAEAAAFYPPAKRTALVNPRPEEMAGNPSDPVPGVARDPGGPTPSAGERTDPNAGDAASAPPRMIEFHFPQVGAEPLLVIYERLRTEYAKPLGEWKFEPIIASLQDLAGRTEDAVVAEHARTWAALVTEHWLPTQRRMEEIERKKLAAERARREARAKEQENGLEKPPVTTPREKEFLAVGWVATLGKYRKVDGTHRLLKGNKLMFYLKSEQLKLDDYVGKRVGIRGVIQQQPPSAGAQLILVTGIQVLSD